MCVNLGKKVNQLLMTRATWANAIIWFFASQIVYVIMLFVTIPAVEKHTNQMKIFDLLPFGYSSEYATILLEQLGEPGRKTYLSLQLPLDFIYPAFFAVTGILFIAVISNEVNHRLILLTLLPAVAALFDYAENVLITWMLLFFPEVTTINIVLASICTVVKSGITTLYLLALLVLFVSYFYHVYRRKSAATKDR